MKNYILKTVKWKKRGVVKCSGGDEATVTGDYKTTVTGGYEAIVNSGYTVTINISDRPYYK